MKSCVDDERLSTDCIGTIFSVSGLGRMRQIYCKCGRIIGMDSVQARIKLDLGKDLECPECRNARISRDIDELNMHFDGVEEQIL